MKHKLNINESFICRLWEGGSKFYTALQTTDNRDIEVLSFGTRNYGSGPDYTGAKISIEGRKFSGDVEIHRDFKSWMQHKHHKDRKYNPVILQVVLWDSGSRNMPKLRISRSVPTVILSRFLKRSIHEIWQEIILNPADKFRLPCYELNEEIPDALISDMLYSLAMERLELRANRMKIRLNEVCAQTAKNIKKQEPWEQVLYEYIFEALGFSANKEQMLKLSSSLTLSHIKKILKGSNFAFLQAMLYGVSGLLFDVRTKDEYTESVKRHWKTLENSLNIARLNRHEWNFFRIRPQNFPTIRIAYGAQVITKILEEELFRNIINLFQTEKFNVTMCYSSLVELLKPRHDQYWETHYDFGKVSKAGNKLLGKQRAVDIITNTVIPLVWLYAVEFRKKLIKENILLFYRGLRIKADSSIVNLINRQVISKRDIKLNSPAAEQAAIQLYNFYCLRERCKECSIGRNSFKETGYEYKIIFY